MDKGLYVAMTGASNTLRQQGTVAHNLANVDTAGFKAALVDTQALPIDGPGLRSRVNALAIDSGFDSRSGAINSTGNELDIALHEDRWLAVQDRAGGVGYTRAGDLQLDANGLLTTAAGHPVLGENGAPLAVPPHQSLSIGGDGTVSIVPQGEGASTTAIVGRLRIVAATPKELTRGLDGLMRPATEGQELAPATGVALTNGAIEGSNVDTAGMLVSMIQLSRQFEMQVKVLKSGDENARAANTLLKMG